MRTYIFLITLIISIMIIVGCESRDESESTPMSKSDNMGIKSALPKHIEVFGINIYGAQAVDDSKLLHAAYMLAGYLDNDGDGQVDNDALLQKLLQNRATLVMWKSEQDMEKAMPYASSLGAQDLGSDETNPQWHSDRSYQFDASIEEVWHLITTQGYSALYPEVFGEQKGSTLAKAMDIARGGAFDTIPNKYPDGAWYTYNDETCDYSCQVAEYFYWGLSSILGAQANRLTEIKDEWQLSTKEQVKSRDKALYALLTDTTYQFPTKLPDGKYPHQGVIKKRY